MLNHCSSGFKEDVKVAIRSSTLGEAERSASCNVFGLLRQRLRCIGSEREPNICPQNWQLLYVGGGMEKNERILFLYGLKFDKEHRKTRG